MLKTAMVCCTPPSRSMMRAGWRIDLMPTRSMASRRVSGVDCTSGIGNLASRWFIGCFLGRVSNYKPLEVGLSDAGRRRVPSASGKPSGDEQAIHHEVHRHPLHEIVELVSRG